MGPFIATLAQLGMESHQFRDEERGGLLSVNGLGYHIMLQRLVGDFYHDDDIEDVGIVHLEQLVQLRQIDLLKKEDMLDYNLVHDLFRNYAFSERRFRFLIEWDPTVLTHTDEHGTLPLHSIAFKSIQSFQAVFETGISYYPHKKGICLLFKKDNYNETPFQMGSTRLGRNEIMDVVEDTITCSYSEETPLNIVDALLTAAIDDAIHLDCVFFLLRRQPDVLVDLLLGSTTTTNNNNNNSSDGDNGSDGNSNGGTNDSEGGTGNHRNDNDGDHGGSDRNDNNYHDNSNHENSGTEDEDDMLIANTDTGTDANENDRKRKRKRTGDV